ncbi:hypothetical protein LSAT2_026467 [Lamellibrachia satsuma]|nr:hypothetical protein LSAT2_026467 [Lamellibrachia satsuma]
MPVECVPDDDSTGTTDKATMLFCASQACALVRKGPCSWYSHITGTLRRCGTSAPVTNNQRSLRWFTAATYSLPSTSVHRIVGRHGSEWTCLDRSVVDHGGGMYWCTSSTAGNELSTDIYVYRSPSELRHRRDDISDAGISRPNSRRSYRAVLQQSVLLDRRLSQVCKLSLSKVW